MIKLLMECFAGREQPFRRQYPIVQRQPRPVPIKPQPVPIKLQPTAPQYKRNIEVLGMRRPQLAPQGDPNLQRRAQAPLRAKTAFVPTAAPKIIKNPVQTRRSAEPQDQKAFKPIEPTKPTEFRRAWSVESEAPAMPKRQKPVLSQFKKPAEVKPARSVEDSRAKPPMSLKSPMKGSGLLTDSLSVIFTRRNNQQWKPSQNYEDASEQLDAEVSDTESACVDCPAPPRISQPTPQPTPDISTEDWFTTKQRILGNVKIDKDICEPMKVPAATADPKSAQVDPHGFDIEPPTHLNKNVSPYVPSGSFERDEYEKYKSEKLKEITQALIKAAKQQSHAEAHYSEEVDHRYDLADQSYEEDQDDQDMEKYHIEKEAFNVQTAEHEYDYQQESYNYEQGAEEYQDNRYYEQQYAEDNNYQYQQSSDNLVAPEAPQISHESDPPAEYYQEQYVKYDETNTFKEPQPVSNQTMCHKCSFQTTNPKKLKDHLKFVHGEITAEASSDLYFRREPKVPSETDLFSRRGDFAANKKFKRRNTANLVQIISEVVVPSGAEAAAEDEAGSEGSGAKGEDSGVSAAMEYFESNKDQPKKARPYRRDPDQMDQDWI